MGERRGEPTPITILGRDRADRQASREVE
jgi:hypothetical protein